MNKYYENLVLRVVDESESCKWESAKEEWIVDRWEEDETKESICTCGKENIYYLFGIRNELNGNTIFPIGSRCIKKFNRDDMSEKVSITEKLFILYRAIDFNWRILLTTEYFSRKLIKYFYENGVFEPNEYNNYDAENDYLFMLEMFNKRKKENITPNQRKKINAIIVNYIKPYLKKQIENGRK